jgi:hypothetical protein
VAGGTDTLVSMTDTTISTTANVNTISNLVAALMSATGDPATLASDLASGTVTLDQTAILLNWNKAKSIMQPLLDALKTSMDDVRAGPAPANGTGVDLLLDSLDATITRNSNGTSTIEITVKTGGDGQQPPVIRFVNTTLLEGILKENGITPTQVQNQPITAATLPPSGTSAQIAELLKRMTGCFALPTATRVNSTSGTAANVTASECKTIFKDDNPGAYRQNGELVSADGALSTLFSDSGTGTGFGQGSFDYKRDNGDIVFSFVSVDRNLVTRNDESVATLQDGKLKLSGNQYKFAGSVNAMGEFHSFIYTNALGYFSTGYNLKVPLQSDGLSPVDKVEVTSPRGTTYTLVPGTDAMVLPRLDGNFLPKTNDNGKLLPSGSAFVRLASGDDTKPFTGASPARTLEHNVYSLKEDESAATIAAYPPRGVWTFAYFKTGVATPVATQTVRTKARAMTLSEIGNRIGNNGAFLFDRSSLAPLLARQGTQSPGLTDLLLPLSGLPSTAYTWEPYILFKNMDKNLLLPVSIRVFGFISNPAQSPDLAQDFSDFLSLTPTMRSATVPCTNASNAVHCNAPGGYAANVWLDGVQLLAREASGREFSWFESAWKYSE